MIEHWNNSYWKDKKPYLAVDSISNGMGVKDGKLLSNHTMKASIAQTPDENGYYNIDISNFQQEHFITVQVMLTPARIKTAVPDRY